MFNIPTIKFPRFSLRFFIYFLFGLALLILLAEGGYYFWIQKRTERQKTKNPVIVREEGVFSYITDPSDGSIQKMIFGTIKKIDGNLLTIKTDNNKIVQVLFTGENLLIADLAYGIEEDGRLRNGMIDDLLIGDVVRLVNIHSENKGQIIAKSLLIVRGANR